MPNFFKRYPKGVPGRRKSPVTGSQIKGLQKLVGNKIGFQNPVPPPPPGGGGILSKLIKFGGKASSIPFLVIVDFFSNQQPVADGTLPDWISNTGQETELKEEKQGYYTYSGHVIASQSWRGQVTNPRRKIIINGIYYFEEPNAEVVDGSDGTVPLILIETTGFKNTEKEEQKVTQVIIRDSEEYDLEIVDQVWTPSFVESQDHLIPAITTKEPRGEIEVSDITELPDFSLPSGGIGFLPITKNSSQNDNSHGSKQSWIPDGVNEPNISKKPGIIPNESGSQQPDPNPEPQSGNQNKSWRKTTIFLNPNGGSTPKIISNNPGSGSGSQTQTQSGSSSTGTKWAKTVKYESSPQTKDGISYLVPPASPPPSVQEQEQKVKDENPQPLAPPIIPPPVTPKQTKVDKCAGSCGNNFSLNPGSDGAGQLISILNDFAVQNPLLKKIDQTTVRTENFMKKAWNSTPVDKVVNLLTLITSLHNAGMLATNAIQSLGDTASAALGLFNITGPGGAAIDVNAVIGGSIRAKIESVIGETALNTASTAWLKLNRIHQAVGASISAIQGTKNALVRS